MRFIILLTVAFLAALTPITTSSALGEKATHCAPDCRKTHSGPVQCTHDGFCFWSPLAQACLNRCNYISDKRECGRKGPTVTLPDSSHCFWRNTTNRCEPRCRFLEASMDSGQQSVCSSHLHCTAVYQEISDTSLTNRSTGGSAQKLTKTAAFCVPKCVEITYTVLDSLPMTQLPVEATRSSAELFATCLQESAGDCLYDPAVKFCVRSCAVEHGACLTAEEIASCSADPRCRFDSSSKTCTERCAAQGQDKAACTAFHEYRRNAASPYYHDAGATVTSVSWTPSQCIWNAERNSCDEDCSFNFLSALASPAAAADCAASPDCFFHVQQSTGECKRRCDRFAGNYSLCKTAGSYCAPADAAASRCIPRCDLAFPPLDHHVVASAATVLLSTLKANCEKATEVCQWIAATNRCENICSAFADDLHCAQFPYSCLFSSASVDRGKCVRTSDLTQRASSSTVPGITLCALLAEHSCIASPKCHWGGVQCVQRCSAAYITEAACNSAQSAPTHCLWFSGTCVNRCDRVVMSDTPRARAYCLAEPHCEYIVDAAVRSRVTCEFRCSALPGLVPASSSVWSSSSSLSATAASAACAAIAGCSMVANRCVRACSAFLFEPKLIEQENAAAATQCVAHGPYCTDALSAPAPSAAEATAAFASSCTISCSFAYPTAAACTADPNCFYSLRQGCLPKCSLVKSKGRCAEQKHCFLVGSDSSDKLTTTTTTAFRCDSRCAFHTDRVSCTNGGADPSCVWTSAPSAETVGTGQCLQNCGAFTTSEHCKKFAALDCVFDTDKGVCRLRCDKFSFSSAHCVSSAVGTGNSDDVGGGPFCVFAGVQSNGCRDRCVLAPSTSVCGAPGSAFSHCYVDMTASVGNSSSSSAGMNGTTPSCKEGCSTFFASRATCLAAKLTGIAASLPVTCVWTEAATTAGVCTPDICASSSGDRQQCLTKSPTCSWHAAATVAEQRCAYSCSLRHEAAASFSCAADPACELIVISSSSSSSAAPFGMGSNSNECAERCSSLGAAECAAASPRCIWDKKSRGDGSSSGGKCSLSSCALRSASSSALCAGSDKACFLHPTNRSCTRACPVLSSSAAACEAEPHCFFDHDATSNAGCLFRCALLQTLSSGAATCPTTQAHIDAISLANDGLNLANHRPHFCDSVTSNSSSGGGTNVPLCAESCLTKNQTECAASPLCAYFLNGSASSPSPLQRGGCSYVARCRTHCTAVPGPAQSFCRHFWGAPTHCGVDCGRFTTAAMCYHPGVSPECVWEKASSTCTPSCYHLTTDLATCHANRNCFFSFQTATCHDVCSYIHGSVPAPLALSESLKSLSSSSSSRDSAFGTRTRFCQPTALPLSTSQHPMSGWTYCTYEADLDESLEAINNGGDTKSISSNSSRCTETCDARYTNNKALCIANRHRCAWLGDAITASPSSPSGAPSSRCATACGRFKRESDCGAESHCFFDGSICVQRCATVATAADGSAACTALNPQCEYRSSSCMQKCEAIFCPTVCVTTAGCRFDEDSGSCVLNCATAFSPASSSQSDCAAHPLCVWDVGYSVCRDHCSRAVSEIAASLSSSLASLQRAKREQRCLTHSSFASHCVWREALSVPCLAACSAKLDAATCATNSDCEVVTSAFGRSVCLDRCTSSSSSDGSSSCPTSIAAGCSTFAGGVCARSCHLRAAATCSGGSDTTCMPDPATAAGSAVCRPKCSAATSGQECVVSPFYLHKLAVLSSSWSLPSSPQRTVAVKTVVPAAHHTCDFFGGEFGSPESSGCVPACATAATSAACSALSSSNCTWRAASSGTAFACRPVCRLLKTLAACEGGIINADIGSTSRSSSSSSRKENQLLLEGIGCAWNYFFAGCEESCLASHGDKASCNADIRCTWSLSDSLCVPSCARFETEAACTAASSGVLSTAALSHCFWSDETRRCYTSCSTRYGGAAPTTTTTTTAPAVDRAQCLADGSCSLSADGRCLAACHLFASAALCRSPVAVASLCVWSSVVGKCIFSATTESAPCPPDTEPVSAASTAVSINNSTKCAARCALFRGDDSVGCSGDCVPVSPDFCVRSCFALYGTDKAACLSPAAAGNCIWDKSRARCQMNCALFSSSSSSSSSAAAADSAWCDQPSLQGQCVWTGSSSCSQPCESRFGSLQFNFSSSAAAAAATAFERALHSALSLASTQCSATITGSTFLTGNNSDSGSINLTTTVPIVTDKCSLFSRSMRLCVLRSRDCVWSSDSNACRPRCTAFTSRSHCTAGNDECDWLPAGGDSGVGGFCRFKCSLSTTEPDCVAASSTSSSPPSFVPCMWLIVPGSASGICLRNCAVWFDAQQDAAGCNAEHHCSARLRSASSSSSSSSSSSLKCMASCSVYGTKTQCNTNADGGCVWLGAKEKCVPECTERMTAGVEEMVAAKTQAAAASSLAAAYCEADSSCMFLASENSCNVKCELLDYTGCVQTRPSPSTPTGRSDPINFCMWDSHSSQCVVACAYAFGRDRPSCDTLPRLCAWSDGLGRCANRCNTGAIPSPQECVALDSAATCRWLQPRVADARVRFTAFGWAQDLNAMGSAERAAHDPGAIASLDEMARSQLAHAFRWDGTGGDLPPSLPVERTRLEQGCYNTSRVSLRVSSSYDDAVLYYGAVQRLDYAQRVAVGESAGLLDPVVTTGAPDRAANLVAAFVMIAILLI